MVLEQRADTGVAGGWLDIQIETPSDNLPWNALSIRYAPFRTGPTRRSTEGT
jgi:hypothetical protein